VNVEFEVVGGAPPEEVLELRRVVLRNGGPLDSARFLGEEGAGATHVLARAAGVLVGVGTLLPEPLDGAPGWRVRGMAVASEWRGQGVGSSILAALCGIAPEGGGVFWCRARVRARSLYLRHGFVPYGEVYEIEGIGPHVTMVRP